MPETSTQARMRRPRAETPVIIAGVGSIAAPEEEVGMNTRKAATITAETDLDAAAWARFDIVEKRSNWERI
ncbi:hypothetical protein LINPERPRIM_LOCUS9032 [Linum perenne]